MATNLKITVVTVSYNAADTIEETILSVINQTYQNIEYIIIDGGSTDGTVDIIKRYADRLAYWVSEPDRGIYDAMNKGIDAATGDYIYFIGADDTLQNNTTLEECSLSFSRNQKAIYYGDVIFKSTTITYPKEIKCAYQLCLRNFSHQGLFYPKNIYKNKKYDNKYLLWADYVYNLELYSENKEIFIYLKRSIAYFNLNGKGSLSKDNLFIKRRIQIIRKLFGNKLALMVGLRVLIGNLYNGFHRIYK